MRFLSPTNAMAFQKKIATTTLLFFVLAQFLPVAAQQPVKYYEPTYVHKIWNNENGLPQNTVSGVVNDTEGYLWAATDYGLVRFDGKNFKIYTQENVKGLHSDVFYALTTAKKGIWAASRNTVLFIHSPVIRSIDFRAALNETWITSIAEDQGGRLWVGTNSGDLLYLENNIIYRCGNWKKLGDDISITTIKKSDKGVLIGTDKGLYEFDRGTNTIRAVGFFKTHNIRSLAVNGKEWWIGSLGKGLYHVNNQIKHYTVKDGLKEDDIFCLAVSPENDLWIGLRSKGVQVFSRQKFFQPTKEGLFTDPIQSLYITPQNTTWMGTTGSGLVQIKKASIHLLKPSIPLNGNIILPIYEHSPNEVWVGTAGKGANRILNGKSIPVTTAEGLASDVVLSIYGNGNYIYVSTVKGINRYDRTAGKIDRHYTTKNGLINDVVKSVFFDSRKRLWATSRNGGIHYFGPDELFHALPVNKELTSADLTGFFEDRDHNIWVGSSNGAVRIDKENKVTYFGHNRGLEADLVECFYQDKDGVMWMGTDRGLARFKDDRFFIFTKQNGLKFDYIYRIIEDDLGSLWISGNKGLQKISTSELQKKHAQDQLAHFTTKLFSTVDGMANSETNGGIFPAGWKMADHSIWFPTMEGVAIVQPGELDQRSSPTNIQLQAIRFGNKELLEFSRVKIPAGVYNIEIDYTSIDFDNPDDVNYYYRLKGLDDDWIKTGNRRTAYFTGLNPGKYDFEVRAERHGIKSESAHLSFAVNPFFYQTIWFKLAMLLVFLGIGATIIYYHRRLAHLKIEEQKHITEAQILGQENERMHLGRELHDNINQQLTTARLYLDFARSNEDKRLEMIERSENVVNNAIGEIRTLSKSLVTPTLKDIGLEEALQELVDSYIIIGKVDIELVSDEHLNELEEKLNLTIYRIVQEHMNNIFKYAEAKNIRIHLFYENNFIHLIIKDDGVGFDVKDKSNGVGLSNIKHRLELFKGSFEIISAPGKGCTLKVKAPCSLNNRVAIPEKLKLLKTK